MRETGMRPRHEEENVVESGMGELSDQEMGKLTRLAAELWGRPDPYNEAFQSAVEDGHIQDTGALTKEGIKYLQERQEEMDERKATKQFERLAGKKSRKQKGKNGLPRLETRSGGAPLQDLLKKFGLFDHAVVKIDDKRDSGGAKRYIVSFSENPRNTRTQPILTLRGALKGENGLLAQIESRQSELVRKLKLS
jgi:hypothetical protein